MSDYTRISVPEGSGPTEARSTITNSSIIENLINLWSRDDLRSWEMASAKILELQRINTTVIKTLTDKREAQARIIEAKFPSATRGRIITRQEIDEAKAS